MTLFTSTAVGMIWHALRENFEDLFLSLLSKSSKAADETCSNRGCPLGGERSSYFGSWSNCWRLHIGTITPSSTGLMLVNLYHYSRLTWILLHTVIRDPSLILQPSHMSQQHPQRPYTYGLPQLSRFYGRSHYLLSEFQFSASCKLCVRERGDHSWC